MWTVRKQARILECPVMVSSPLISPLFTRLLLVKIRRSELKTRVRRLTASRKSSLLVDFCQLLEGASQKVSSLKRQLGDMVFFQRQRLLWTQLDYRYVSYQISHEPLTFLKDFTVASYSIRFVSFHVCTNQQKLTSPLVCVLVYNSAGEPARQSVHGSTCEQSASGSEYEVGGATS